MQQRSILILGGTGFIGRHIAAQLCAAGHLLHIPTRKADSARRLKVLPTVRVRIADVHDPEQLEAEVAGCDVVINLIGILNERGSRGDGFAHAHTELAQKLIDACTRQGVRRLIQMSSLKAGTDAPSHYLKSKGRAEELIRASSLDWTILQPSVVFGSEDSFTNRFAALLQFPILPLARPNARFAPVYVDDVATVAVRAVTDSSMIGETFELCGPKVYSLRELVDYIRKTRGLSGRTIGLPDSIARLQARLMEWVPGKPFSMDNYRSLTVHSICDKNGFKRLGIEPQALESIAPGYLARNDRNARLSRYRETAGR